MKSPEELNQLFSASEYGQTLNTSIRFKDFKPIDIPDATWTDVLGDDVNNLLHMRHTHKIAERVCTAHNLNEENTTALLATAMTHDWGEAIDGDIALPSKTSEDEISEEKAFRLIAEDLLGTYDGEELSDVVWRILNKDDEQLGDVFRAVEYIGYNTTAMRGGYMGRAIAARLIRLDFDRPTTEHLAGGLLGFESAMQAQSYPILAEYGLKYPGIQSIIGEGVNHTNLSA